MSENENNLDFLLERSRGTDVPLLLKAKEDLKRKIKENSDPKDIAALNRVNQMLRDAMSNQDGNKTFTDLKQVVVYIRSQGRKRAASTVYRDMQRGLLRRQPDMSFKKRDVDTYATMLPLISMPERQADENSDLAREKLREDMEKSREQKLSIRFDRERKEGKYILREDVALELASRASALALGLRSVFRLNVADYIRMVGGDVSKAEELAAEFEKNLDMALNEYSKPMDFKVEYVAAESGESAAQTDEWQTGNESGSEQ